MYERANEMRYAIFDGHPISVFDDKPIHKMEERKALDLLYEFYNNQSCNVPNNVCVLLHCLYKQANVKSLMLAS